MNAKRHTWCNRVTSCAGRIFFPGIGWRFCVAKVCLAALVLIAVFAAPVLGAPPEAVRLNHEGIEAMKAGRTAEAIDKFKAAIALDPAFETGRKNLALAYTHYGIELKSKPDKAIAQFHKAVFLDPSRREASHNLKAIISMMGKDPDSFSDRVSLAEQAVRAGDRQGAIIEFDAALSLAQAGAAAEPAGAAAGYANALRLYAVELTASDRLREAQEIGRYLKETGSGTASLPAWLKISRKLELLRFPSLWHAYMFSATLAFEAGDYRQAADDFNQALVQARQPGQDVLLIITALNNLALVNWQQGSYPDALPLAQEALALCHRHLGGNDAETATSANMLAMVLAKGDDTAAAEKLYRRAIEIARRVRGQTHPALATYLNNLASLKSAQGETQQAERLFKEALAIDEQALGREHPKVAVALHNLAVLYSQSRRFAEAEPLYKRCLAIRRRYLNENHPDLEALLRSYALFLGQAGRGSEAASLEEQAEAMARARQGQVQSGR